MLATCGEFNEGSIGDKSHAYLELGSYCGFSVIDERCGATGAGLGSTGVCTGSADCTTGHPGGCCCDIASSSDTGSGSAGFAGGCRGAGNSGGTGYGASADHHGSGGVAFHRARAWLDQSDVESHAGGRDVSAESDQ